MPSKKARIRARIARVDQIDWARFNGGPFGPAEHGYLVARMGTARKRFFGRGPEFSGAGPEGLTLPLLGSAGAWYLDVTQFEAGDSLEISVEAWIDRGDLAPTCVATTFDAIYYHADDDIESLPRTQVCSADGSGIRVHYEYEVDAVAPQRDLAPSLSRSASSEEVVNHIELAYTAVTTITDVRGLYRPRAQRRGEAGSVREAGYKSSDDAGRIFVNQDPDGNALDGDQWIELSAQVDFINADFTLGNKTIKWTVNSLHDDPSNDKSLVHREAGRILDPGDYDHAGRHGGSLGNDNEGRCLRPMFGAAPGFALAGTDEAHGIASTAVKYRGYGLAVPVHSKIWLRCPDVGGDRFSVQATLVLELDDDADEDDEVPVIFPDTTGIMTMWKRVPVEVYKMRSAFELPTLPIADKLASCFVQLEFGATRDVEDVEAMSTYPGGGEKLLEAIAGPPRYPPVFVLLFALHDTKVETKADVLLKMHETRIVRASVRNAGASVPCEAVSVPGNMKVVKRVAVNWAADGVARKATFNVQAAVHDEKNNVTWLYLTGHDVTRDFTGMDSDGSTKHAYRSKFEAFARGFVVNGAWQGRGYGSPETVRVSLEGPGGMPTSGVSPFVSVKGQNHFAGRTILFTHHGLYNASFGHMLAPTPRDSFATTGAETLAHEFCHAFGMPHKCAHWDFRTPREKSCCMNYSTTWIMSAAGEVVPGSTGKVGGFFCASHMKEVRRVGLHRNPVYRRG